MRVRQDILMIMAAAAIATAGCASQPATTFSTTRAAPSGAVTSHVVVISVDGLRPDAIARFGAVALQRLMRAGSFSLEARTIALSTTLPSHTSMLTGQLMEDHGVVWNTDETATRGRITVPTVFGIARQHGFRTAAFFSKSKFNHLMSHGTLDHGQAPGAEGRWSADRTIDGVERYMATAQPNLLFVHIGEPDYAGHLLGWMSWWYARGVRTADAAVERIVSAADRAYGPANYTLIVTADHGGHGRTHGTGSAEDVTIPWIAYGRGVRSGVTLAPGIHTVDTAATILWLLGLSPATWGTGTPVREAFTDAAQRTVDDVGARHTR